MINSIIMDNVNLDLIELTIYIDFLQYQLINPPDITLTQPFRPRNPQKPITNLLRQIILSKTLIIPIHRLRLYMPQPITTQDIGLIDSLPFVIGYGESSAQLQDQASSNLLRRLQQGKEHTELIV